MKFFYKLRTISLFLLAGLMLCIPVDGRAQKSKESIQNLLEKRDAKIKKLLGPEGTEYTQQQRDALKDIINGIINYKAMAKYALQDTYDNLSKDERSEFVDLFSTIIRDQSLNKLDIYRAKVTYDDIKADGNQAVVKTTVQKGRMRKPVTYKMEYSDEWKVTDIIIDDVSTADSYRTQFQNIIEKKGYDSLLKTLRERASKSS